VQPLEGSSYTINDARMYETALPQGMESQHSSQSRENGDVMEEGKQRRGFQPVQRCGTASWAAAALCPIAGQSPQIKGILSVAGLSFYLKASRGVSCSLVPKHSTSYSIR